MAAAARAEASASGLVLFMVWAARLVLFGLGVGSSAEDGGADADDGGALGEGDLEVMRHAHGEFRQSESEALLELVAEGAQGGEEAVQVAFGGVGWGDGHQSDGSGWPLEGASGEEGLGLFGPDAEFGGLAGDIDFDQEWGGFVLLGGDALEASEEFGGVDGVDAGGVADGESHLVGLEVSDEMPFDVVWEQGCLLGELLGAVFAEGAESGVVRQADVGDGEGLGDGEEARAVEGASGAFEGAADAFLDLEDAGGDVGHGRVWLQSAKVSVVGVVFP